MSAQSKKLVQVDLHKKSVSLIQVSLHQTECSSIPCYSTTLVITVCYAQVSHFIKYMYL